MYGVSLSLVNLSCEIASAFNDEQQYIRRNIQQVNGTAGWMRSRRRGREEVWSSTRTILSHGPLLLPLIIAWPELNAASSGYEFLSYAYTLALSAVIIYNPTSHVSRWCCSHTFTYIYLLMSYMYVCVSGWFTKNALILLLHGAK